MNILHLSPYFPDLEENHAGGVCMGKQVETLQKEHQVYVLTFLASEFDRKIAEKYRNNPLYQYISINKASRLIHVLLELFLPNYFAARSSLRFTFKMIRLIKKHHIQAVHAEYASMGQYFWIIKWLYPTIRIHLVEHDVTLQSYERKTEQAGAVKKLYYKWQCRLIKHSEGKYCIYANEVLVFNHKDKELLFKYYKVPAVQIINPYYGGDSNNVKNEKRIVYQYASICFLGQMGRRENYEAAERLIRISKKVKEQIPELDVYIVGNNPPEELKGKQNEFIHVTGFVEDIDQYLLNSQIAVFPLNLGAGIKLKVLRSLALGVPVITGKIGAEGIDEEGKVIVLAEKDGEYEDRIKYLINHEEECERLSLESRKFVSERFGWDRSAKVLSDLYRA